MKKSTVGVLIAVVAVLLIGGIVFAGSMNNSDDNAMTANPEGVNTSGTNPPVTKDDNDGREDAAANTVTIRDFAFAPDTLTVKKGTTVTWTNEDSSKHDVTPDQETADFKASNLLAKGETYSVTFNTVGSYSYFCSPHPYMKAMIEVTE